MEGSFLIIIVIGSLLLSAVLAFPIHRIMKRAGLNPALSFIVFVPVVGYLLVLGILAFSNWPNEPEGFY